MNVKDTILLDFASLPEGATAAGELCPVCEGSRDGIKGVVRTLSVTRESGSLKWYCHRASCDFKGGERGGSFYSGQPATATPNVRGTIGRQYHRQADRVPDSIRAELEQRYCITAHHLGKFEIGWDEQTQRLVIPVYSHEGELLGSALRSLNKNVTPKVKTHTEQGAIAWFFASRTASSSTESKARSVVIVEDCFSAIRASDYLSSVALLGTHLNEQRVDEVKEAGYRHNYLALDSDAWESTIRYCVVYRSQLSLIPVKLTKDIKDMSNEELSTLVRIITEN